MASCSFSTLLERVTACGLSSCYPGHVEVVSLKECTRHIFLNRESRDRENSFVELMLTCNPTKY